MTYISTKHFNLEVSRGKIPGMRWEFLAGFSTVVGTTFSDIIPQGGVQDLPQFAGEELEILSDSPDDTAAGDGMRTILIVSLDSNYVESAQVVTLDFDTPVPLSGLPFRLKLAVGQTSGVNGGSLGTIKIRRVSDEHVRMQIDPDFNLSQSGIWTTPAGETAYGYGIQFYTPKNQDVNIRSRSNFFSETGERTFISSGSPLLYQNSVADPLEFTTPPLPEKLDFRWQARSALNENITVAVLMKLLLVKN